MRRVFLAVLAAGLVAAPAIAKTTKIKPRADLADMAAGQYDGSVISDARGAGRSNVRITVTKTGPNTVSVTSSYNRLPPFTTKLARYMQTIQNTGPGKQVFLLELAKSPHTLGVTDDDASWSGTLSTGE